MEIQQSFIFFQNVLNLLIENGGIFHISKRLIWVFIFLKASNGKLINSSITQKEIAAVLAITTTDDK